MKRKVYLINPDFYGGDGQYGLPRFYFNREKANKFALDISYDSRGYVDDHVIIKNIIKEIDYDKVIKKMFKQ